MALIDILGAFLTLVTLALLGISGYLLALRLLRERAETDPLALAVAWLLSSTSIGLGIGIALGAVGLLRIELGLAALALALILLLHFPRKLEPEEVRGPVLLLGRRLWARVREHPALSVIALHAAGSEALRGLLRPPLSWDAVMYHMLLAGTWLQDKNLAPVFGFHPTSYYGYAPANGSVWMWWWLAPSHSELYANLAYLPQWLLLGLAVGLLARTLGAVRHWPLAGFLAITVPVVARFVATPYVDIFASSCFLAAVACGLLWLREPRWGLALLIGAGLGVSAGAKVIGVVYGVGFAGALVVLAIGLGRWPRRLLQVTAALLLCTALGGFFYLRNMARGVHPLATICESMPRKESPKLTLPRHNSAADLPSSMFEDGQLLDSFLGVTRPQSLEMGLGPVTFLAFLALLLLPFGLGKARFRESTILASQVAVELAFWAVVPFAAKHHVFANTRYLLPVFGIVFAAGIAMAERRGVRDRWLSVLALMIAAQSLLQMHTEMPRQVRLAMGAADLAVLLLALSPRLQQRAARHWKPLTAAAMLILVLAAPILGRFRFRDRARAFSLEYTAHATSVRLFASGWEWLDRFGGDGTVDAVMSPGSYFTYPAMGPYFERKVVYVNINRQDLREAAAYPGCEPRRDPDPDSWKANLDKAGVRWLLVNRYDPFPFPVEDAWAASRPDLFALRFRDNTNRVYEYLPGARAAAESR
jgi:hypothetical protein